MSTAAWITITSNASGQGDGSVAYRVAENTDPVSRRGMLAVNDAQVPIAQDPAPCRYTVAPAASTMTAAGGALTVHVDSHAGCAWTSTAQVDWIQVTAGASGNGPGNTTLAVRANSGVARTGTVMIAGQIVSVTQASGETPPPNPPPPPGCSYTISPPNISVGPGAANGSFALSTASGCAWTATPGAQWISLTSPASGSGSATIAWAVTPNTGAARTGTIGVGGQTFTISQAAACAYTLTPAGQTFPAAGGTGTVSVSTTASCGWTATSNAAWITLAPNPSGTGSGSVTFTVAPNSGAARSGAITIGGQTFTVEQDAPSALCTFSITPTSQSFGPAGGNGSVSVTASGPACAWTAVSNASWISLGVAAGIGNGTVSFSVAAFNGGTRTGTLIVAGQTFTVTQTQQ